jgi:hypothetical protein
MSFLHTSRLYLLAAFLAVFVFAGDIIADSIGESCGDHCATQSSQSQSEHEKAPCSHCSCCAHSGTVIFSGAALHISADFGGSLFYAPSEQSVPTGLPVAIDHPPQLA